MADISPRRLEQLEEFRQMKALEKSARTDRIKKRVQELQDKRRQTISLIRSELGINHGEKGKLGLPAAKQLLKKADTTEGKSVALKSSRRGNIGTFTLAKKQTAFKVSEKVTSAPNPSQKSLVEEKKRADSRRLTLTLSDSLAEATVAVGVSEECEKKKKIPTEASGGRYKENRDSQKPAVMYQLKYHEKKTLHKKTINDAKNHSPWKPQKAGDIIITKTTQQRKRVPVTPVSHPIVKKSKTEVKENAEPDKLKATSISRAEQLKIWQQQKKDALEVERRKTMSVLTAKSLAPSNLNTRHAGVDRVLDATSKHRLPEFNTISAQIAVKKVTKLFPTASMIVGQTNVLLAKEKTVKVNGKTFVRGLYRGVATKTPPVSTIRRRSTGITVKNTASQLRKNSAAAPVTKCSTTRTSKSIFGKGVTVMGPQVSTPYTHRRKTCAVESATLPTPSISCIPRRKTVAFMTPTTAKPTPKQNQSLHLTEEMCLREKLNKWMAVKGKTPSRYRHLMCFGLHGGHGDVKSTAIVKPPSSTCKSNRSSIPQLDLDMSVHSIESSIGDAADEDTAEKTESASEKICHMINESALLLTSGFPATHLLSWLNELSASLPMAQQLPSFWVLKAEVIAKITNDHEAALRVLDEAVAHNVQPSKVIDDARAGFKCLINSFEEVGNTSHRVLFGMQPENVFRSSAVKLCLRRIKDPLTPLSTVVTPVRRSTRKSCSLLPPALRDHDVILESTDEIAPDIRKTTTFKQNLALSLEWQFASAEIQTNTAELSEEL